MEGEETLMPDLSKPNHGWVYVKKRKTKAGEGGHWPESKRVEVLTTYLSTGSPKLTVAITGVPMATFEVWKKSVWWKEMEEQIRNNEDMELSAKLKKVVDKSLETVLDRMENGDFMYDPKEGRMVRVPVKMRDTHKVMTDVIDKRMLLQKRPTKITEHQTTVDDRLKNLAQQFAQFVTGKQQEQLPASVTYGDDFYNTVIDVTEKEEKVETDAISEERET